MLKENIPQYSSAPCSSVLCSSVHIYPFFLGAGAGAGFAAGLAAVVFAALAVCAGCFEKFESVLLFDFTGGAGLPCANENVAMHTNAVRVKKIFFMCFVFGLRR
jgi:hypothetical protein